MTRQEEQCRDTPAHPCPSPCNPIKGRAPFLLLLLLPGLCRNQPLLLCSQSVPCSHDCQGSQDLGRGGGSGEFPGRPMFRGDPTPSSWAWLSQLVPHVHSGKDTGTCPRAARISCL